MIYTLMIFSFLENAIFYEHTFPYQTATPTLHPNSASPITDSNDLFLFYYTSTLPQHHTTPTDTPSPFPNTDTP